MEPKLLTRDEFREAVFKRDGHKCVVCGLPAQDAHHILERRLFSDGGYYLDNGASVCGQCHKESEQTVISAQFLRDKIGAKNTILPQHLYKDHVYDKWGNVMLPDGTRMIGELFYDESVQKILKEGGVLNQFRAYVKYPRTYHLPWSESATDDDRSLSYEDLDYFFNNQEVVVTLKMDGENTSMYSDHIHARSIDGRHHFSRDWVKNLHSKIKYDIPQGWRLCGENLYAEHSIAYKDLESYFMLFSVWNEKNECLSWDDTVQWAELIGISTVPVLYRGVYDEKKIKNLHKPTFNGNECEGYVMRLAGGFRYKDFRASCGKYVRKNHIRTHGHWTNMKVGINKLKDNI